MLFTDIGGRITENTFTIYHAEFFKFFEGRRLPENTITIDCLPVGRQAHRKKASQVLTDNGELITVNGY